MIALDARHTREDRIRFYGDVLGEAAARTTLLLREAKRWLALNDLFFLLTMVLKRKDLNHDWLYARCQEVQAKPNGYLDLWAREHGKSSVITFGKTVQDVLADPEITVGIFSHTRPSAKGFLRQIMMEFERNADLIALFPDVLWTDPKAEAPKWSEDDGLVVKRKGNPKESTVEAWGLVEGLPTGKHFRLRVYDDVVDSKAVTGPDMMRKVMTQWELSLSLGTRGGLSRYIGTRYHANDVYREILARGTATPRIYPATRDGTVDGDPVLMTRAELVEKRRDMGIYTYSSQMLQNPTADRKQGFQPDWIRHYRDSDGAGMNKFLIVDPASEKKRQSDYTAMVVIGLGQDQNYYLLDAIRDRLNLRERGDALFALHRRWRPNGVGYEKYGQQCDIEHLEDRMERDNYRFEIKPLGGQVSKPDRIKALVPLFEQGRFHLPESLLKTDYEGRTVDLVSTFIEEEYKPFPVAVHDDLFDAIARIQDEDLGVTWPKSPPKPEDRYARRRPARRGYSPWAA